MADTSLIHVMVSLRDNSESVKTVRQIPLEKIRECVVQYFGIDMDSLTSKRRLMNGVRARMFYCALARRLTWNGTREIGKLIGNRDHSTVIHALQSFKDCIQTEWRTEQIYNNIRAIIFGQEMPYPHIIKKEKQQTIKRLIEKISEAQIVEEIVPEVKFDRSQNNNGYSHNHDHIYQ